MKVTPDAIRKLFILRHGEHAFELVAKRYAEVAGDSTQVDLSTIPEWRDFAIAIRTVPGSDVLTKAFLWCNRHASVLADLNRRTVPAALEKLEEPDILRKLFDLFPFFIANSPNGYRCMDCFDAADQLTEQIVQSMNHTDMHYLIAKAESVRGQR